MVKVVVTAMPARAGIVSYLQMHIPELTVVWDRGQGAMDTFKRAWATHGTEPRICLQDDVILCRGFYEKALSVIEEHPDAVIQFFSMRKHDLIQGSRWVPGGRWLMNQCHYLPKGMAPQIAAYAEDWGGYDKNPTADDMLMADLFRMAGIKYYNHVPNLVDHAPVKSEIDPRRSTKRQSKTFSDPEYAYFPEGIIQ